MALFLLHATEHHHRNSSGLNSVLVDAADAAAARAAAASATPNGEVKVDNWADVSVATTPTLPGGRTVVWFEGVCASLLGVTRGGNRID